MRFDQPEFIFIFMPLAVFAYYFLAFIKLPNYAYRSSIIIASFVFYWINSREFVFILFFLTMFNFIVANLIRSKRWKILFLSGISINLLILGWYKYGAFIINNLNSGFNFDFPVIEIVLPLGISFFVFQKVAYLTEVWRGDREKWTLMEFFLLVWFFPQLVAGPIVRPHEFIPQLRALQFNRRRILINVAVGLTLFIIGLAKKLVVSDSAGIYADMVFGAASSGTAPKLTDAWIGIIAFSIRIYFDFSGYSDMAIGIARIFGFQLPINFNSPYQATSIIDFWRRWHMTLSRFLRDFLYIPLGGNRVGQLRRYANLMIVMLLGGLWHGANWTFVAWGGMHGLYLAVNHIWKDTAKPVLPRWLGRALTLVAVVFAWVPFRAPDFTVAMSMWRGMVGLNGVVLPPNWSMSERFSAMFPRWIEVRPLFAHYLYVDGRLPFLFMLLGVVMALALPNPYQWLERFNPALYCPSGPGFSIRMRWSPSPLIATGLAGALAFALFFAGRGTGFIYWQF